MTESIQLLLWDAVDAGDPDAVAAALAEGADPNKPMPGPEYLVWADKPGRQRVRGVGGESLSDKEFYVLFDALDDLAVLNTLLAAGVRLDVVNDRPDDRPTALHQVVRSWYFVSDNEEDILRSLLAAGAPVDQINNGRTPLQALCNKKWNYNLLEILLEHGASVSAMDYDGYTALHLAVGAFDLDYEWHLDHLKASVQRYAHDRLQSPPSEKGWILLDPGPGLWGYRLIGPYAPVPEDDSPDLAFLHGVRDVVRALVAAGADPNAVNPHNGDTPLHHATNWQDGVTYLAAVEALIEFGARPDIRNHEGRLARDFFFFDNNEEAKALFERLASLSPDTELVRKGW